MITRYAGLGDTTFSASPAFRQWGAQVDAALQSIYGDQWRQHGAATTVPSNIPADFQQYVGQPAARFDIDTYQTLRGTGQYDDILNGPRETNAAGNLVYILAPSAVAAGAPHTMTMLERAENAALATGDDLATAAGLPSLGGIHDFLTGLGKEILVGVAVTVAVAYVLKRKR